MFQEKFSKAILVFLIFSFSLFSEVKFVSKLPNPNEYYLFATSGWTGNWYIGPDHCWIQEFENVDFENYEKVFIGAKIGRAKRNKEILESLDYFKKMKELKKKEKEILEKKGDEKIKIEEEIKTLKKEIETLEKEVLSSEKNIYISITDEPMKWKKRWVLVKNSLIPLQGSYVEAIDGVGEARWFWVEIPKKYLRKNKKLYIAVWSDYKYFKDVNKAPILAAGWGDKKKDSWVCNVKNEYPDFSTKKNISFFEPAIGIKLVRNEKESIFVKIKSYKYEKDPEKKDKYILRVYLDIKGKDITKYNLLREVNGKFIYFGFFFYNPPYIITVKDIEKGKYYVKAMARNWQENVGFSDLIEIRIK